MGSNPSANKTKRHPAHGAKRDCKKYSDRHCNTFQGTCRSHEAQSLHSVSACISTV